MIRIVRVDNRRVLNRLVRRPVRRDRQLERLVARIIEDVRSEGDRAVSRYARRYDHTDWPVEFLPDDLAAAARRLSPSLARALSVAAGHIRKVARRQLPRSWQFEPIAGIRLEQRVVPLERVGCYVPGGRYPLPSSLLMTAIPAQVAGVNEIVVMCPRPTDAVLAAAHVAGVGRLWLLGGAQAIACLAYGTATVPRVDKIVGPGNRFVTTAKALVAPDCAIDLLAGPTEIAIVTEDARPDWVAADLLAQAEHDPDARAVLVTPSRRLAVRVREAIIASLRDLPDKRVVRALQRHGAIILTANLQEAIDVANTLAPEHLVCDPSLVSRRTPVAGTIFVGNSAAPVAGDYATGATHVLPTGGGARWRGGLSAADFVRTVIVQRHTRAGLKKVSPTIEALAMCEGLQRHAASIRIRLSRTT